MRLKISDKMHSANRLVLYLLLIAVLSLFCFLTLDLWLLPYSIAHAETGKITAGYLLYAAIGIVFSTPGPFWAVLVISLVKDRISLKQMLRNIFKTEKPVHTVVITGAFCAFSLVCASVRYAERLSVVPVSARFSDHDTVRRNCRGNRLAGTSAA